MMLSSLSFMEHQETIVQEQPVSDDDTTETVPSTVAEHIPEEPTPVEEAQQPISEDVADVEVKADVPCQSGEPVDAADEVQEAVEADTVTTSDQ